MRRAINCCSAWIVAANILVGVCGAQTPVRIGLLIDGPWERNEQIREAFEREALDLVGREFDVRFPADKRVVGNWTTSGTRDGLNRLLADPTVDIIIASGPLASNEAGHRTNLSKPVIAPFILNQAIQEIPIKGGASGIRNLVYVAWPSDLQRNLQVFQNVVPFKRMAYVYSPALLEAIPDLAQNLVRATEGLGIQTEYIPVRGDVAAAVNAIPASVEAVYVLPLLGLDAPTTDRFIHALNERKLPSFSVVGTSEVERGMLVGTSADFSIPKLARRVAINIQRILLGEDPATFQVLFTRDERLTINMATARRIGVYPNWTVLTEAVLVDPTGGPEKRPLNLGIVIREAVEANLNVRASEQAVASGRQNVAVARSLLLPQIEADVTGAIIDEDLGSPIQAQKQLTGTLGATQLIFSEQTWANLAIQKRLQAGLEAGHRRVYLDVVREATVSYLNVLRALTLERIRRNNLKVSRSNLDHAQVRREIGTSNPSEVYRWQSQIANDQQAVIDANVNRNLAEIDLNRVLHRPLEEPFQPEDIGLDDPRLLIAHTRLKRYLDNPGRFRILRSFLVDEGLVNAPEIRQFDAVVAAQERALSSAKRSFISPTVGLRVEATSILDRSGAGAQLPAQGGDRSWTIGVSASLPLFEGGGRLAEVTRNRSERNRLVFERNATRELVEQRTRSALHRMGGSFASIRLSREAADAATNNLDLTIDGYSRGVLSILSLIDAQNAALSSDLGAANAVYAFLIDLMEVERAVGRYSFFMNDGEIDDMLDRLDTHLNRHELTGQ